MVSVLDSGAVGPGFKSQLRRCRVTVLGRVCVEGPFDNTDSVHIRVLQTIYRQLTGARLDCPRYGDHWQLIGFQGYYY